MGISQRRKGLAQEYALRNWLRQRGWTANRVPSSGAAEGFCGDIEAEHPEYGPMKFELKSRKDSFKKIYELYAEHCKVKQDDVLSFVVPGGEKLIAVVSTSLDAVLENPAIGEFAENHPLYAKFKRTFQKIGNMQKLLKGCQVLAVKDDRRCLIFMRFR